MAEYQIHTRPLLDDASCRGIAAIYEQVGWGRDYSTEKIRQAWACSTLHALAVDDMGRAIGLIRGFSDGIICSWLAEVAVLPSHQKKGLGQALVALFLAELGHTAVYAEALTSSGSATFLAKCGLPSKPQLLACARAGRPRSATRHAPSN